MDPYIVIKYVHLLGILGIAASLAVEAALIKSTITASIARQLAKVDGLYGLSSIVAVGAGMILWFVVGKPAAFYTDNPVFLIKVGLAIFLGILSLPPSVFLWKAKKKSNDITVPAYVRYLIYTEVAIILIIPLLATIMAQGVDGR